MISLDVYSSTMGADQEGSYSITLREINPSFPNEGDYFDFVLNFDMAQCAANLVYQDSVTQNQQFTYYIGKADLVVTFENASNGDCIFANEIAFGEQVCVDSKCLNEGNDDADVCCGTIPSCQAGYVFSYRDVSNGCSIGGNNGSCCTPDQNEIVNGEKLCVDSACLDDGSFDDDCCAGTDAVSCETGYTHSFRVNDNGCQ